MERRRSAGFAWGVILVLLGLVFLAGQALGLAAWLNLGNFWPLAVVGVGLLLLIVGVLGGTAGLAVPACVVGGVGLLLYYQNATGDWGSWAYTWALIPGFVGAGIILAGLLGGTLRQSLAGGIWLVCISGVLFAVFGSFLGPFGSLALVRYWPILLIIVGFVALVQALGASGHPPAGE